jgi:RNA recognition motif-containing protein
MVANVFVARLSQQTTERELLALFAKIGPVTDLRIPSDPQTHKSRCFAFVEMRAAADAKRAIAELNGWRLQDRIITNNPTNRAA